jgi:hypothetical protein
MQKDQRDLLLAFNEQSVRYLIVGAYAVGRYTEPRATKDLDVFIDTSDDNAQRVFVALASFGAPLQGLSVADFQDPYSGFQFGVPRAKSTLSSPSVELASVRLGSRAFREEPVTESKYATSHSIF